MKNYNEIVFCIYDPCNEKRAAEGMSDFMDMCKILIKNEYTYKVSFDGMCAIIQYGKPQYGGPDLIWEEE